MFLKFKNKFQMAIDKMLDDSKKLGGDPDNIIIEPSEAYSLLKEAAKNPDAYKGKLSVVRTDSVEENVSVLWKNIFISNDVDSIKKMVTDWYKLKYKVTYSGVELKIVKPKEEVPKEIEVPPLVVDSPEPAPPEPRMPYSRIIRDDFSFKKCCSNCGSTLKTKWLFFHEDGCIQPECDNYWEKSLPKEW